jgi:hypothetical protein
MTHNTIGFNVDITRTDKKEIICLPKQLSLKFNLL